MYREQIHLVIPRSVYKCAGEHQCTVHQIYLHLRDCLEILVCLFPAADIPESITLERQFDHAFFLVSLPEYVIGHSCAECRYACTNAGHAGSLTGRHRELRARSVGAAEITEDSFCIIKVDPSKPENHIRVEIRLGASIGCKRNLAVAELLQIISGSSCVGNRFSVGSALICLKSCRS